MRAQSRPHDPTDPFVSPGRQVAAALVLLAMLYVVILAAAYPGIFAAFVLGAASAVAVHGGLRLARADGICVPGTDVCFRLPS